MLHAVCFTVGMGIISRLHWRSRKTGKQCWHSLSLCSSLCLTYSLISLLRRQHEDKTQNTSQIIINFKSLLIVFCFSILLDVFHPVFHPSIFSELLYASFFFHDSIGCLFKYLNDLCLLFLISDLFQLCK